MAAKKEITLNQKMSVIGFNLFHSDPTLKTGGLEFLEGKDLERVLIDVAYEGLKDFRVLSVLLSWITVHAEYVIVEKFTKLVETAEKIYGTNRVIDLMAVQALSSGHHKWKKLIRTSSRKPVIPIDAELLEGSIKFQGASKVFKSFGLLVPEKFIRIRVEDVKTPEQLAKTNHQYRNRLIYGAAWRADLITAIEFGVENPNQAARILGCSYQPAYRVYRDYRKVYPDAA